MTKREEFAAHWAVAMTAFFGVTLGTWGFPFYVLGPLIKPLEAKFGWSRTAITACSEPEAEASLVPERSAAGSTRAEVSP